MKVVIDEKVKHRFVGIAVILSIGIVFAPAVLKKSQRRLEDTVSLSVKLPPKPVLPKVSVRDSKALFQTVKVARVEVPAVDKSVVSGSTLAKAEPLSPMSPPNTSMHIDSSRETMQRAENGSRPSKLVQTAELDSAQLMATSAKAIDTTLSQVPSIKPKSVLLTPSAMAKQPVEKIQRTLIASNPVYGVQLATFAIHSNAIALVGKLKNKGYQAQYNKVLGKNGVPYYKVVVGPAAERAQAQRLLKQLAQAVQINGFVVTKEIS
ncbi:MAG: hypothetical protein A3F46_03610 [Legionellales bacterium RIFCSPHIGHO2_12_FULL_42_9]|nr:MAG: hypothetical protein A3F46_03610 [Legionellales bacterium RIFCSPHIGHO2_12_FULL_42_9]